MEVCQLKEELRKSRKRSCLMETLLLKKTNGLCDSGNDIEQVVNNNNRDNNLQETSVNRLACYCSRDFNDSVFHGHQDRTRVKASPRHTTNNMKRRTSI